MQLGQENPKLQSQTKSYTHLTLTQTIFCIFVSPDRGNSTFYYSPSSYTLFSPFPVMFHLPILGNKNHHKGTIQNNLFVLSFYIHQLLFFYIFLMFTIFFKWIHEPGGT